MRKHVRAVAGWLRRLPTAALAALIVLGLAGVVAAGVFAYRTWDYVEHDNEFCLSCHLMVDPYERFSESAHRGLACKACHQPTFVTRSTMALTQVLENPEELETHAEVPSARCVECHVEGDPERWTLISRSIGHRVHLESQDPSLEGLECVQCHSSGVHEFTATDQTCGQAGCHEDTEIRLGRMADLTIHCVACHDFSRPEPEEGVRLASVAEPLRPEASECLSCHQMRLLVGELPDDEPHGGVCGACHNPHEQTEPREAVQSCASSGCHVQPDTLTPFHRGLDDGALQQCTLCHQPHDTPIDEIACVNCHSEMQRPTARAAAARALPARGDTLRFSHQEHGRVECTLCHNTGTGHGTVTVRSFRECQSCHHDPERASVECSRCHSRQEIAEDYTVIRRLTLSTGAATRQLGFEHESHRTVGCTRCHAESLTMSTAQLDCGSCHEEHHRPNAECSACHTEPATAVHPLSAHVTCAGSGCHSRVPFTRRPDTRPFCLVCHQDMVDHEPGQVCTACHGLPAVADLSRTGGAR